MDPCSYPIEILHFLNPYLIWVKRKDQNSESEIFLEQIGIFGLLPLKKAINEDDDDVVVTRSEKWVPAVNTLMKDYFDKYTHYYFVPIHIDRRSSVFNDNIHKFGNIYVVTPDNERKNITSLLVKSGFAEIDDLEFYSKVYSGIIKTKLNPIKSNEIVTALLDHPSIKDDKNIRKAVLKNTSITRNMIHVSNALATKNLEMHNRNQNLNQIGNVSRVIEKKCRDLEMCKVEDEMPLGRGNSRVSDSVSDTTVSINSQISESQKPYVPKYKMPNSAMWKILKLLQSEKQKANKADPIEADAVKADPIEVRRKVEELSERTLAKHNSKYDFNKEITSTADNDYCDENPTSLRNDFPSILKNCNDNCNKNIATAKNNVGIDKKSSFVSNGSASMIKTSSDNTKKSEKRIKPDTDEDVLAVITSKALLGIRSTKRERYLAFGPPMNNVIDYKIKTEEEEEKRREKHEEAVKKDEQTVFKKNEDEADVDRDGNYDQLDWDDCEETNAPKVALTDLYKNKTFKQTPKQNIDSDDITNETDSDEEIDKIKARFIEEYATIEKPKDDKVIEKLEKTNTNVNPFQNLDYGKSVFVDKLVGPILMVHTKNGNLILPHSSLRDIPFQNSIKNSLSRMSVKEPRRLQTVSWYYILRGHSVFMIGPAGSGKTLGYVPALCNLVMDDLNEIASVGPICIIVCATAKSVSKIANLCKFFLGLDEKVLACYHGLNLADLTTSVLNGCEILVSTPPMLNKLLMTDLGVDLKRLSTLVFDDCERLSLVYEMELKSIQYFVKEMYKHRVNKQFKVQYVVASRLWCDFMRPLAKKAPNTIVSIVAFQECVLYSQASTSVELFLKDSKINSLKSFLNQIDRSKRTVIVCRTNDEVELLEKALSYHSSLFVCNDLMTLNDCHNMNEAWSSYKEPVLGPILLCCDGNLTLLNITDAHYLVHFSMPSLFSMFCSRFAVLNDNYASIFYQKANEIKIKIMLDETNVEQLPKILNFVKRCTSEVPEPLEEISKKVLGQKDYEKGKKLVPLCDSLLSLSECSDFWNCKERHAVLKEFDEPKDWMPKDGHITFKILHFDTAVTYSAKLLSHVKKSSNVNYLPNYSMLSLKMGLYFSKESNRKLHGFPKVGDICAVAIKPNFYNRCQVIKIRTYFKGNPHEVLINLIDEEQLETVRDVYLYHLPDEFKVVETHVVKVRLANIQPQDKDVTYSDLAKYELKKIIESDEHLYLRGEVSLTVGNTIFVNTLEACQDLDALNRTVVKHNLKMKLLESHAKTNPDHMNKLIKLCEKGGLKVKFEKPEKVEIPKQERNYRWAYLPKYELVDVIFAGASDPSKFFVVLNKFEQCCRSLLSDIKTYVEENPKVLESFEVNDVVLAEFPDDYTYERARIEEILDGKVYCFFVDRGDMRDVSINKLKYLPDHLIEQLPFQVIECRLIGVKPPGTKWSEFAINWLCDLCLEAREGLQKILYLKCFTTEKAEITGGNKYGVSLIDTNTDLDLNINKQMIELNLACKIEDEMKYLDEPINLSNAIDEDESFDISDKSPDNDSKSLVPLIKKDESDIEVKCPPSYKFPGRPIKSFHLPLADDNSEEDFDINLTSDFAEAFGLNSSISRISSQNSADLSSINVIPELPMIEEGSNTDDSISSVLKNSSINSNNIKVVEGELNNNININATDTQKDKINFSHDCADGNNIPNSTESNKAKNTSNAEDISLEYKTSTMNSLDDPKIVLDIENLSPSKSNVFKMFAKSKFGILANKNIKIDDLELSPVISKTPKSDIDSDDFSSTDISQELEKHYTEIETPRKPKIVWRQNKNSVTIKIPLVGVENYTLEICERSLEFKCKCIDMPYEFNIDLYGVINIQKSKHANKGQYIQINLEKLLKRNWLNLTKGDKTKNWIVYDVDSIDASSDEEAEQVNQSLEALKQQCKDHDTDSEDDFDDDIDFIYGKHRK